MSKEKSKGSAPQQKHWFPLIVLLVGIGALLMFSTTEWVRARFIDGVAQVRAIDQIQTKIAISHLWVEEHVTDDFVDLNEISKNIDDSKIMLAYLDMQLKTSNWLLDDAEQAAAITLVTTASSALTAFHNLSERRIEGYRNNQDVGIGSAIDAQFDAVFSQLLVALRQLNDLYDVALTRNDQQTRLLVGAITLSWLMFIGLTVIGLWQRERRRRDIESALQESESRLQQSQKLDSIGRLAGGIAHDINNHLAAITLQCEIVKLKAVADDPINERMDAIINIGGKSADLIRRLLAFSRKQPIQPEIVDVENLVTDTRTMLTRLIGDDIQLQTHCQEDLWNVLIDPSQLEQIFLNLVINARDAMPGGGVIDISIENNFTATSINKPSTTLPQGHYVVIRVSDQGTGIPPSISDKIYEPFFTTKQLNQSSGLGLATVHGIVKQNNGFIEFETQRDKGTTFTITLPRTTISLDSKPPAVPSHVQPADIAKNILLIEDNPELRDGTKEILTALGYSIRTASDGKQGLKLFDIHHAELSLIITDVVMPKIGGKEVAEAVWKRSPELPIIFMSGYADDVVLKHGVEAGDVDFLPKPFTAASLATTVQEVLSRIKATEVNMSLRAGSR